MINPQGFKQRIIRCKIVKVINSKKLWVKFIETSEQDIEKYL